MSQEQQDKHFKLLKKVRTIQGSGYNSQMTDPSWISVWGSLQEQEGDFQTPSWRKSGRFLRLGRNLMAPNQQSPPALGRLRHGYACHPGWEQIR